MKEHGAYTPQEARTYDRDREVEPLWHAENAYVESLVRRLEPISVLDVPVGTGRFLDLYGEARVEGVDLSYAMLAEASTRVAASRHAQVTLRQGSVTSLPFADRSFDLVVCWRLLHLLPPDMLRPALAEMARVCNGQMCVQVYERAPLAQRTFARALRWLRRFRLLFSQQDRLTPWSHITSYAHSREDIQAAALGAGLGKPTQVDALGVYEGTRVFALVWRVA
jgi:ubiquinone/menaquinone biosynthesis C-methylase UbiE